MPSCNHISSFVRSLIGYDNQVFVSEYSYKCVLTGVPKKKTVIVLECKVNHCKVITIHKPIHQVTTLDLIKNYKNLIYNK